MSSSASFARRLSSLSASCVVLSNFPSLAYHRQILPFLPPTNWRQQAVTQVILAVLVIPNVFPFELILTAACAARAIGTFAPFVGHHEYPLCARRGRKKHAPTPYLHTHTRTQLHPPTQERGAQR